MTSLQAKKDGTGVTEGDRQKILKQMKVRTTLKKDKSWIQQQNAEEEKDEIPGPVSPELRSLESRRSFWSAEPDPKVDRNSGTFAAKEIITSSSSPPVQSSNKRFSYSTNESSTTTDSQQSPPPSITGNKPATSYIIRGQPVNAVFQVKSPPSFNGYQKSTVQARTTSLPRVPTASGGKMSTEEYKKLAPYNLRNKSVDLSDDETPYTPQEQVKRTEQASGILRNTSSKDRSYVISAAKRNSGTVPHEAPSPYMAQRVEIHEEENNTNRKSQTLPKTLSSYLHDDVNRYETPNKQTTSQTSPPTLVTTDRSSSPKLTSYSTSNTSETRSSAVKPEPGKITAVIKESDNKVAPKPAAEKETSTTRTVPTKTERVRTTEKKSDSLPNSLASYLYNDVSREAPKPAAEKETSTTRTVTTKTESDNKEAPKPAAEKEISTTRTVTTKTESDNKEAPKPAAEKETSTPRTVTTKTERVRTTEKKSDSLPNSLASYLYDDVSRFEKKWQANSSQQPASQAPAPRDNKEAPKPAAEKETSTPRTVTTKTESVGTTEKKSDSLPNSLASYLYDDVSRFEKKWQANQSQQPASQASAPRDNKEEPKPAAEKETPTTRTVTTKTERETDRPECPKMTSWSTGTETGSSSLKPEPGKITVLREESDKSEPKSKPTRTERENNLSDLPKLYSKDTETTNTRTSVTQTGPGKITVVREESTIPKPVPRMETKPKDAPVVASNNQLDLISWSDLDDSSNRVEKEKTPTPTPVPRHTSKDSEKPKLEAPLIVISPELNTNRTNQPPKPEADKTVTETRYRVPQTLDEPEFTTKNNQSISDSEKRSVTTRTTETKSEPSRTPEPLKSERSSSPRPSPRSRDSTTTTVTESRYRVPETLEDTMLESSPARSSSRTTVTTTRSTDLVYNEYVEEANTRPKRTVSSSRDQITTPTTTDTHYESPSPGEANQYDPQSSNKAVLFVKEYVNTSENLKSPTSAGSFPDFSNDSDRVSYSSSSSYLYNSAPIQSDEGPCTYCGREIKDCAKITLEHLGISCHEFCFKCGICHKPMGDLIDSMFICRNVVHCESCYDKLF